MGGKQDDETKREEKPRPPSTGQGADSAMDALIKGRVSPPAPGNREQQPAHREQD